ncbi:hypothetical protein KQ721_15365, partial [Listeria monocytogenes]|nr:hypothetical protein [Listeria monocytogenes]
APHGADNLATRNVAPASAPPPWPAHFFESALRILICRHALAQAQWCSRKELAMPTANPPGRTLWLMAAIVLVGLNLRPSMA